MNYSDPNDADKAISTLNGLKLQTKTIKVSALVSLCCPSPMTARLRMSPIRPYYCPLGLPPSLPLNPYSPSPSPRTLFPTATRPSPRLIP